MKTALLTKQASVESYKNRIAEEKDPSNKAELEKCLASELSALLELKSESAEQSKVPEKS